MASYKGITIDQATFGRDEEGLKKLKANLTGDIDKAISTLTNSNEYQTFHKTVYQNWMGEDAMQFMSEFEQAVSDIASTYKQYKQVIINALDADLAQFEKMQHTNASMISGKSQSLK